MSGLTTNCLLMALFLWAAVTIHSTEAQRSMNCDVRRLIRDPNKVIVHCNCMQRLTQMSLSIAKLTINQTDCNEKGLELSWPELETKVAPEVLVLVGARIFFMENTSEEPWDSSVKRLKFVNSEIKDLPANVFKGMDLLEEVRLINSSIDSIKSDAFSNLGQLKLVEIASSTIVKIEDHAFNNLQALEDLAFVSCSIGSIESGAISLISQDTTTPRCPGVGRSLEEPKDMLEDMMGRELSSIGNISLPDYGTRLLLFKNNIIILNSQAINSNTLGFLIVGGNQIVTVESEAFNMELYNECEVSAALFMENTIDILGSYAFKGLRGKDGASYQAFIALANNTFMTVFDQGFRLSDNLVVFAVEKNSFACDCDGLDWILSHLNSRAQRELEKEVVSKASCLDDSSLIAFTSSCTDHRMTTTAAVTDKENPTRPAIPDNGTSSPEGTTNLPPNNANTVTCTMGVLFIAMCTLLL